MVVDDGSVRDEVILDTPEIGLHIPPMVWGIQYMYTENALMLVFTQEKKDDLKGAMKTVREYLDVKEKNNNDKDERIARMVGS